MNELLEWIKANRHKRLQIVEHGRQYDLFSQSSEQCYKVTGPSGSVVVPESIIRELGFLGLIEKNSQNNLFDS